MEFEKKLLQLIIACIFFGFLIALLFITLSMNKKEHVKTNSSKFNYGICKYRKMGL